MVKPVFTPLLRGFYPFQVFGANTDVGKTIISTLLLRVFRDRFPKSKQFYLKPVSTGSPQDRDDRHLTRFAPNAESTTLLQFAEPVSPHLVTKNPPADVDLAYKVATHISNCSQACRDEDGSNFMLVETAGGVHSPTLTGSSQADLYRYLRLPVYLVADSKLGGISSTISSFESLLLRGYDVVGLFGFKDNYYRNDSYLKSYFSEQYDIPFASLEGPPSGKDSQGDAEAMENYYTQSSKNEDLNSILVSSLTKQDERIDKLVKMPGEAAERIWYPFTQHTTISKDKIPVIESAYGDFFQVYEPGKKTAQGNILHPMLDGSSSWWTQGLGHGNPSLTLAAAYASGRYGHVMFAGTIHEPALKLANDLLKTLKNPRLNRVFYSDDGSTGMEVALKMALRASRQRYGYPTVDNSHSEYPISILGLKGSYHGDTIGVMNCAEPGIYNKEVEWYNGSKGFWFDFPTVRMVRGQWEVSIPEFLQKYMSNHSTSSIKFNSLSCIFDLDNRLKSSPLAQAYRSYIEQTLENLVHKNNVKFGALIIEPLILGAGGMLFCDPLFQRVLVDVVRNSEDLFKQENGSIIKSDVEDTHSWKGLPVVFDEVFVGLYRLGRPSASSFLGVDADIVANAKLLTGGLIPLCTTSASESIFKSFLTDSKADALLHGHSYTAHPIGCNVAIKSLEILEKASKSSEWAAAKEVWKADTQTKEPSVWSTWSYEFLVKISNHPKIESCFAIGSVFVFMLATDKAGYTSSVSESLLNKLREIGEKGWNIHARGLGSVVYIMSGQTVSNDILRMTEETLLKALE